MTNNLKQQEQSTAPHEGQKDSVCKILRNHIEVKQNQHFQENLS